MTARRRLLAWPLLALPAMLAGCGWEPLYADRESDRASVDLRAIKVLPISDRIGQQLEFALRSSLNPGNDKTPGLYTLRVALNTNISNLGIQSQGLGTRGEVNVGASYTLTEDKTNKTLQANSVHASDSFDIQANGYSTVVAQQDAYTRAIEEIRREIVARLTLYMQNRGMAPS